MGAARAKTTPPHPVMGLLTAASLVAGCFDGEGRAVKPYDEVEGRFAGLASALEAVPPAPGPEWDPDCWHALMAAAKLTARVPSNWRAPAARVLSAALELTLRLNPEERRLALEGIADEDLPQWLRH